MSQLPFNDALIEQLNTLARQENRTVEQLIAALIAEKMQAAQPEITRRQTESMAAFSLDALDLAADIVVAIDSEYRIVHFNHSAEQTFGYAAEEVLGLSLEILLPDESAEIHPQHIRNFALEPAVSRPMNNRTQVQGKRKDGSLFTLEASILKYEAGGNIYYAAILRDVSERVALLAEMQERKRMLEVLTDNATDMILLHTPDATIIYASPSCETATGYSVDEIIGTNPFTFMHPEDNIADTFVPGLLPEDYGTNRLVYRYRRKDNTYIWLETFINPVQDDDGELIHYVTISRDITQRREIEEALKRERDLVTRIMETSPTAITVVASDGRIVFANRHAEELYGLTLSSLTQRSYDSTQWQHTDFDGNPWPDEEQPFIRVMRTRAPVFNIQQAISRADGERIYLSINGAPMLDEQGEVSTVVFIVEDVTEREQQRIELEEALYRQEQLNELRASFISLVSHEFRTPLAVIMTSTGLIRMYQERGSLTPEELETRLKKIDGQVNYLASMLSDVTFINKSEIVGHTVTPVRIDLEQFFTQLVDETHMAHPNRGKVKLIAEGGSPWIFQDQALMLQIFNNLLGNAVKYSPSGEPVLCSYRCTDDRLLVRIEDKGIGIPKEDQVNLFELFFRGRNVAGISGTGLGLAIVKRAVDALRGSIEFESDVDTGTMFTVSLPLLDAPASQYDESNAADL